ncbi:unnamed protein product [Gadus morhua 'NCC']
MQPSFPGFEGCIGCILRGPTYPKILHGPTYPSQDSLRTQSMEMAENGDLSFAFKWSQQHTARFILLRGENDERFTGVK